MMKRLIPATQHVRTGDELRRGAVDRRNPRARAALRLRIVNEFAEMRGHPVTAGQASRLFGVPPDACRRILEELTHQGDLRRVRGHYTVRAARP